MKRTKVKVPAKINLTLDVLGKVNDYHKIRSLVSSVNIYDEIKVVKRKDNKINLHLLNGDCGCVENDNNAYKAGKLFVDRFHTHGADIYLKKNIPISSGMGGSSADIAGVLKCMKKLYKNSGDIVELANELGSDSGYMLNGGYAVISGKGEEVVPVRATVKIPTIIITSEEKMTSKECYKGFDSICKSYPTVTFDAVYDLVNLKERFFEIIKNDLQAYAQTVLPSLQKRIKDLTKNNANCALMTGSGSAVYGLYLTRRARNKAYRQLRVKYKGFIYKCVTK